VRGSDGIKNYSALIRKSQFPYQLYLKPIFFSLPRIHSRYRFVVIHIQKFEKAVLPPTGLDSASDRELTG